MTHVSISRSYAVLVGLEAYVKTRKKAKKAYKKITCQRDKILSPEAAKKRELDAQDKSRSAEQERQYLKRKEVEEKEAKENRNLMEKLHISHTNSGGGELNDLKPTGTGEKVGLRAVIPFMKGRGFTGKEEVGKKEDSEDVDIEAPGTGPENAIAPEGTRET